ncbi:hypothetical protein [Sphingomonas sp. LHG3406-1]|uniref:hypothetical protein n=1 Tax=Sphingomonas sp. LHG3406-1 TaxID=2804617 RepID=UPI00261E2F73|nr:hypothetical protein [Sphingomonas sp. LHG3406-1]
MRVASVLSLALLAMFGAATPAHAARIIILTNPMTLERRTVVIDQPGPDRIFLCAMPPATTGCRDITPRGR